MRYYTETIPYDLALELKDRGMSIETAGDHIWCPSYAEVFDWLMGKGLAIRIDPLCEMGDSGWVFDYTITCDGGNYETYSEGPSVPWHDAANAAIRKALEFLAD